MNELDKTYDQFVEKTVLQYKLVAVDKLEQAKAYQLKRPDLNLLDILTKSGLIKPQHAETIQSRYPGKGSQDVSQSVSEVSASPTGKDPNQPPAFYEIGSDPGSKTVPHSNLKDYLERARKMNASDLHISVNAPAIIRKNGRLAPLEEKILSPEETEHLLVGILNRDDQRFLRENLYLDTCLSVEGQGRYRSCFVKQRMGWDGSFRIIPPKVPTFSELGLPDSLQRLTEYNQGLVLVTGPSSSGKSASVAAMIELINRNRSEHIITLEDPIEYVFTSMKSHISQRQIGNHSNSFASALRAALREDPDIIMIGELRDLETASLAITAAETGHLVFATLHTTGAEQTIYRLLDFFPPDQQQQVRSTVSESIRGIVCQRLIPRKDGKGRVLALETMFNVPAVSSLIREDRVYQMQNMMKINHTKGMMLMADSIQKLLEKNIINEMEAHYAFIDQYLFQNRSVQGNPGK